MYQHAAVKPFPLAIVVSKFNQEITAQLLQGAQNRLRQLEFSSDLITIVHVPGAIEIPITAQRLAKTKKYQAIIALGAVIRGDTDHYDYVCDYVTNGCLKIALKQDIPVIFGVLTTDTEQQAQERVGGTHGHKGIDAVDCAVEMVDILRQVISE